MKITVLLGSPKGDQSVTLQYVHYLQKVNPTCEFHVYNIAQQIRKIEGNQACFDEIIDQVRTSEGVLWAFPLYIMHVHAHYKRFIELISERMAQSAFAGKYAATLSTSIHFFDHTAHNYIQGICDDWGMNFVEAFSPEMNDLLKEKGRRQLVLFGNHFFEAIRTQAPYQRRFAPLTERHFTYQPGPLPTPQPTHGKKVVIVHDGDRPNSNLPQMVARCQANFCGDISVIDLNTVDISASCQGCIRCGAAYQCAYEGKDGFIDFYRTQVMAADVIIYSGTIVDRYLSSRWKMALDRSFFNTHTPRLIGKQIAFLISGPYSQLANLDEILSAYTEFQMAHLVGVASDEYGDSAQIDARIDWLSQSLLTQAAEKASRPMTFLGIGGVKIFRDDIWGQLRMIFPADHHAYQQLGLYKTFPQHDLRQRLLNVLIVPLLSIPNVRQEFNSHMKTEMIRPLQKVVEDADPQRIAGMGSV